MRNRTYNGMLCIGDPHLSSRVPGFRRDEYPKVILKKLAWALEYARANKLLPTLLGDLFHYPRDNANWLIVELMQLLDGEILAVAGNHDCNENSLGDDDTLSVLHAADKLILLDRRGPWIGKMGGVPVVIGGTCWGQKLPREFDRESLPPEDRPQWVFWITHHDIKFPGCEESGRTGCRDIPGVDVVINGHIHRTLQNVAAGATLWINPGNIARVNRGDATRAHQPGVLHIEVIAGNYHVHRVPVPHEHFDKVFYPEMTGEAVEVAPSVFIQNLAALQTPRTADGVGLRDFLDQNLGQFPPAVSDEIRKLAREVLSDAATTNDRPTQEAL